MKTLLTALFASVLIAGPAFACGWNKTADKKSTYTASTMEVQDEEAMTTFDPVTKPAFEDDVEPIDARDVVEEEAAE